MLSSMCRLSFSLCRDHLLIKAKLVSIGWSQGQGRRSFVDQGQACLHVLESRLREEKMCVDQGFVRVDQHSSSSEDMP